MGLSALLTRAVSALRSDRVADRGKATVTFDHDPQLVWAYDSAYQAVSKAEADLAAARLSIEAHMGEAEVATLFGVTVFRHTHGERTTLVTDKVRKVLSPELIAKCSVTKPSRRFSRTKKTPTPR